MGFPCGAKELICGACVYENFKNSQHVFQGCGDYQVSYYIQSDVETDDPYAWFLPQHFSLHQALHEVYPDSPWILNWIQQQTVGILSQISSWIHLVLRSISKTLCLQRKSVYWLLIPEIWPLEFTKSSHVWRTWQNMSTTGCDNWKTGTNNTWTKSEPLHKHPPTDCLIEPNQYRWLNPWGKDFGQFLSMYAWGAFQVWHCSAWEHLEGMWPSFVL
jgi:hypothetical protein